MDLDVDELCNELAKIREQDRQRSAAVYAAYRPLFLAWANGLSGAPRSRDDALQQAEAVADRSHPVSPAAIARRQRAIVDLGEAYLATDDVGRRMLETVMDRSWKLVPDVRRYLADLSNTSFEPGGPARSFALCAVVAGCEDHRDLLVRLFAIVDEARRRSVEVKDDLALVESLADPYGVRLFQRLRAYYRIRTSAI
jgi:hypothetical protein